MKYSQYSDMPVNQHVTKNNDRKLKMNWPTETAWQPNIPGDFKIHVAIVCLGIHVYACLYACCLAMSVEIFLRM